MKRVLKIVLTAVLLCYENYAKADEVIVPLFKNAPTIDGKIDPKEWSQASRIDGLITDKDKLERRSVRTYVGATQTTLYVAIQSRLPDEGPLLTTVDHDGLKVVYDDAVEVYVDPKPEQADRVEYQLLANSLGHAGFQAHLHGKGAEAATWNGNWQQAQSQADGYWNFECAIPIASMSQAGEGRKATDGTWMINLCRDWRPDWGWSSFTGKYPWAGITFRFVDGATPVVSQIIQGDPSYPQGGAQLEMTMRNPTSDPMTLNAQLHLVRNNMPEVTEKQNIQLAANEEKSINIKFDGNDPTTIYNLNANVTAATGGSVYFNRSMSWNRFSSANRWVTQKPKDASLVDFQFAYYPSKNRMRVMADISAIPSDTPPEQVSAVVSDRLTQQEVKAVPLPIEQFKKGRQEIEFDLPPLSGLYLLKVQARGEKLKPVELAKPFERKVFPWENTPVGRSTTVYPPFTRIEIKGKQLSTVLRQHDLNDLGLLDQVKTANANTGVAENLLAGAMTYHVTVDGKLEKCVADAMKNDVAKPNEATFEGHIKAGGFSANWKDEWDYDGTAKVSLTLLPSNGKSVQDLTLEIPLRDEIATMISSNSDRIRTPITIKVPAGNGVVWDGSKVACDEYIPNFCPYIFLGDANRGLCWFADNDRNWGWNPATPNLDVSRQKGKVVLRLHLINQPTVISEPKTIVFGLLAAPVKPRLNVTDNANWYRYRFNRDGYRLLGTDINWFGNHSCGTVYPAGRDMYLWEELGRSSKEKLGDAEINAFAEYGKKYFVDYGKDKVELWVAHVNRNLRANYDQRMIFYYNRASCPEVEEFETFKDEWCLDDYRATTKSASRDEIKVVPSESYINYNLYWNARSFEVGNNKGVYWDNWFIAPSFNTEMTDAYRNASGKVIPSAGIWGMREQAKRTFLMMNEKGVSPVIIPHITTFSCLPMLSFATAQYDWEWKYSEGDVQDRFSREYIQLVTSGELAGTWPVVLHDQLALADDPWTQRTFAAVRLLHELDGDGGHEVTDKLLKPVTAILDKPGTIAYRYWEDRAMPVQCTNADVPLAVYVNPSGEVLVVAVSYDSKDVMATLNVDWKAVGLSSTSKITNAETGEAIVITKEQIVVPMKKHDIKLISIVKAQ